MCSSWGCGGPERAATVRIMAIEGPGLRRPAARASPRAVAAYIPRFHVWVQAGWRLERKGPRDGAHPAACCSHHGYLLLDFGRDSVPVVDLEVVGRRLAFSGLGQRPEAQEERCPLHAAMGCEFHRFVPVAVTEQQDGVLALSGKVEGHV